MLFIKLRSISGEIIIWEFDISRYGFAEFAFTLLNILFIFLKALINFELAKKIINFVGMKKPEVQKQHCFFAFVAIF